MLTDDMVNREFTRVFKGYDVDEVEDYIEALIDLYNQVANENRELVLRCDALNTSLTESEKKLKEAADTSEQKDSIILAAQQEAQDIIQKAREKAQSTIETAEETARELLLEVKTKTEEADRAAQQKHSEAQAAAKQTVESAMEEAKKLIKATKLNCVKRSEECEKKIANAEAEYDNLLRRAADFRAKLFSMYSEQILAIESLEIDGYESTEGTEEPKADSSAGEKISEEAEPIAQQPLDTEASELEDTETSEQFSTVSEPQAEQTPIDEEQSTVIVFEDDRTQEAECEVSEMVQRKDTQNTDSFRREKTRHSEPVLDISLEKRYAAFSIEKEHSGQVQYNSSEIASVNKKLDDIISKKGEGTPHAVKSVSKKLGFLK